MKQGFSNTTELAAELRRRASAKRDFVVDTSVMRVAPSDNGLALSIGDTVTGLRTNNHMLRQVGTHLNVPAQFHDRMLEKHPDLLSDLLNGLLHREPTKRMVRTLDGTARAFLSDGYRVLDNEDLAEAVLPVLASAPDMQIVSADITETRFYLKALFPRIQTEVKRGDPVQAGIVISNSEVGNGSLSVSPLVFRLVCLNGMIAADYASRKRHVGRKVGSFDDSYEVFKDETRRLDDAAFWAKLRDVVSAAVNDAEAFERIVNSMREATERTIEASPMKVVELTAKKFGYNEKQSESVLTHLLTGGDLSQYGLMNAITRASQDVGDYDLATQMERDGGRLIELPKSDWKELAQAA